MARSAATTLDLSDLRTRLSAVASRWNIVEGRIKEVQNIDNAVFIPAINELRYAGRKVVDAWAAYDDDGLEPKVRQKTIEDALAIVEQYVENADHDVTDAICVFLHLKLQDIVERYKLPLIREYHPEIFEFLLKIEETNEIIQESRRTRNRRNDIYERLESEYIPALKLKYDMLRRSEKIMEMDRIVRARKAKARLALDVVLFVLAILGGLAAVELFWPNWNEWWTG